jgi:hypothetical protein
LEVKAKCFFLIQLIKIQNVIGSGVMVLIGELYQIGGTLQNAFCRGKRIIAPASECRGGICAPATCPNSDEQNTLQFLAAGALKFGIIIQDNASPAARFLCENP